MPNKKLHKEFCHFRLCTLICFSNVHWFCNLSSLFWQNPVSSPLAKRTIDNHVIMIKSEMTFDFALSFAGEDREIVSNLNRILINMGAMVFYDLDYQHELLGKELVQYLRKLYSERCKYCIVFISKHYKRKLWPSRVEWPSIISASVSKGTDFVIPIVIDDTELDGLSQTVGYLDYKKYPPETIASILIKKLRNDTLRQEETETEISQFKKLISEINLGGWFIQQFSLRNSRSYVAYDIGKSRRSRWEVNFEIGSLLQDYDIATIDTNYHNNSWGLDYYMDLTLTPKGLRFKRYLGMSLLNNQ